MSLLADIISKEHRTQSKSEIPPNLKDIIQTSQKRKSDKKKLIRISAICAFLLLSGATAAYFLSSFEGSTDMDARIAAAKAARMNSQTEQNIQAAADSAPGVSAGTAESESVSAAVKEPGSEEQQIAGVMAAGINTVTEIMNTKNGGSSTLVETAEKLIDSIHEGTMIESHAIESSHDSTRDTIRAAAAHKTAETDQELPIQETESVPASTASHNKGKSNTRLNGSDREMSQRDSYLYRGRDQELKGNYLSALENYRTALELDKDNVTIINNIAYIYLRLGLVDESVTYGQQVLQIHEENVPALINLGIASATAGDSGAAEDYLARAIKYDPGNQDAMLNLAILYERDGNFDQASRYYEKLVLLENSSGYLGLARSYEKQGNFNEALNAYRRIQDLDYIDEKSRSVARQRARVLVNRVRN
jgi:Flp pilus assembly protein TadD